MEVSRTQIALEAIQSGTPIDDALAAADSGNEVNAGVEEAAEPQETEVEESTIDDSGEEASGEDVEENAEESESLGGDVEELLVNGRKVKVDFTDREKLKTYVKMAGLARKKQAEADTISRELKELKPKYEESLKFEQAIENAFNSEGIPGLINLVSGEDGAYEKWFTQEYERRRAKEDATPAELERIELQEQLERERKQRERIQREREEELNRSKEERSRNEQVKLENMMHPAFNKHRFAGKLGDASLEADVDSMVWSRAINAIGEIPDDVELTPRLVEREFRKAANSLNKLVERQTKSKVSTAIQNKKKDAASKVAIAATKGQQATNVNDEMTKAIAGGNLKDAFNLFRSKLNKG